MIIGDELSSTTVFGKFVIEYERLDDGSLLITDPTGRSHIFYFSGTGLILKELANGTKELVRYDAQGRCLRKVVSLASGERYSKSYKYSAAGDLSQVEDSRGATVKYHYDAAHRLKVAEREDGRNDLYAHDKAGNLTLQPGLDGVRIGSSNKLKQANGERFDHDRRDNVVLREGEKRTTRYEYDSFDQLVGISLDGRKWRADYDALGRRTRKQWLSQTAEYYWDDDRLAAEIRPGGSFRLYVYADERALAPFLYIDYASLDADPETGEVKYLFTNQLGAPERVENDFGRTIWQGEISAYGAVRVEFGRQDEINLRFPGHYYDVETGLHYNRFRYYDPTLGCYLQCDPLGVAGSYNLYSYLADPLTDVDILGLSCATSPRSRGKNKGKKRPKGIAKLTKRLLFAIRSRYNPKTKAEKGKYGERKADKYMRKQGFTKVGSHDKPAKGGGPPRPQGIDGVYKNSSPPPKWVVAESKFDKSTYGMTKDGKQMSQRWVDKRLDHAVGRKMADQIRLDGYERWELLTDRSGNVTQSKIPW